MKILVTVLLFLLLAVSTPSAEACGWIDWQPVFWREIVAGPQRDALARGQVGIIDSTWSDAGLYLAWRHLEGLGVPEGPLKAFWIPGYDEPPGERIARWSYEPDVLDLWREAVKAATGTYPRVSQHFSGKVPLPGGQTGWASFLNCLDPAFKTAIAALAERELRWKRDSRELNEWLLGQNRVFEACSEIVEAPPELDASWPANLRADRQYQIAATDFYAMRYEAAIARFRRIAADNSSAWRKQAAFSVGRVLLRQELYAEAAAEFRALLKNNDMFAYRESAEGLATFAELRSDSEGQAKKIEAAMRAKKLPASPMKTLVDARWLANGFEPSLERPLLSFLRNLSMGSAAAAYAHWLEAKNPTRLVVALIRATEDLHHSDADSGAKLSTEDHRALVDAAGEIGQGSPAYLSARFYRAVLLTEALGSDEEARKELDQLFASKIRSPGDVQRLRHLRAHLAQSWQELVAFGLAKPLGATDGDDDSAYALAAVDYAYGSAKDERLLIPVAGTAISRLASLEELAQLQQMPELPKRYRNELAFLGFLRSALSGKEKEALGFADAASLDKNLAPLFQHWRSAKDAESKKFEAVLLALQQPGMAIHLWRGWGRDVPRERISAIRQNWWCAASKALPDDRYRPAFLRGRQAPDEAGLGEPDGPNYLGREVLTYAAKYPDDPRLPRALHFTVRATRYGCNSDSYAEVSKGAFTLLHQRFPKSSWAQKTPYWFK